MEKDWASNLKRPQEEAIWNLKVKTWMMNGENRNSARFSWEERNSNHLSLLWGRKQVLKQKATLFLLVGVTRSMGVGIAQWKQRESRRKIGDRRSFSLLLHNFWKPLGSVARQRKKPGQQTLGSTQILKWHQIPGYSHQKPAMAEICHTWSSLNEKIALFLRLAQWIQWRQRGSIGSVHTAILLTHSCPNKPIISLGTPSDQRAHLMGLLGSEWVDSRTDRLQVSARTKKLSENFGDSCQIAEMDDGFWLSDGLGERSDNHQTNGQPTNVSVPKKKPS